MQNQGPPAPTFAGDSEINWITTFFMAAFHVGAIAALFFFTWKALFVAMGLWWISGSLGISIKVIFRLFFRDVLDGIPSRA
jgi:hypothetical protein